MSRFWSVGKISFKGGWLALLTCLGVITLVLQAPTNGAAEGSALVSAEVQISASDDERLVFEVTAPAVTRLPVDVAGHSYEQIVMSGYDQLRVPGQPDLPHKSFVVALPPGAVPVVSVLEQERNQLTGVDVVPVSEQELVRFDGVEAGVAPEFIEKFAFDETVYGESALYPSAAAMAGDVYWLRDQRVVSIMVRPVQVNPVERTLLVNTRMVIEVAFTYPEGQSAPTTIARAESAPYEHILQTSLLNYEQAQNWRGREESHVTPQTSPCLADWNTNTFRIKVENTGIHQITYAELAAAGLSGTTASNRIQMCHFDQEIAILVEDGGDGTFGSGDKVVFYGETIKTQETETNIYWLTVDPDETGVRIQSQNGAPGSATIPTYYPVTSHVELDAKYFNLFPTEDLNDHWYADIISYGEPGLPTFLDMAFSVNNLESAAYMVTIRAEVWGFLNVEAHRYRVLLNGTQVGPDQYFYGSGKTVFHLFEEQVASSALVNGNNTLKIQALDDGTSSPSHSMLVNWGEIDYRRRFVDESDRLVFSQPTAGTNKYSVSSFATAPDIFNVTNPYLPVKVTGATGTSTVLFEWTNGSPATFALSTAAARHSVVNITKDTIPTSRLQTTTNQADYIIITDPSFTSALSPLISRRTTVDGLAVRTVYVQDIFDEFGYGVYDTEAIRRFLEYTYTEWASPAPSYVLLVGKGSYDHRNILGQSGTTANLVPVYLRSGVDRWLGETASDNQYVEFDGDDLADMMLGRLPVRTAAELTVVINKIIAYETAPLEPAWHAQHLFVTDNGKYYDTATAQCKIDPAGDFFATANGFIQSEFPAGRQFSSRIFYAPTQCYPPPQPGDYAPTAVEVQTRFREALNQGRNFVVYTGHSGVDFWAGGPPLITTSIIQTLTNGDKTPIMLPMTCLEGFYHTPELDGFSETMLKKSGGGAVASYAPTGLQVQTGHNYLIAGFYEGIFTHGDAVIGEAIMHAKMKLSGSGNASVQDLHDTFMLLGDPAMHLRIWQATDSLFLPVILK